MRKRIPTITAVTHLDIKNITRGPEKREGKRKLAASSPSTGSGHAVQADKTVKAVEVVQLKEVQVNRIKRFTNQYSLPLVADPELVAGTGED
jgi:hypothetical protein